jgi:arginine decarboxylase
MKTKYIDLIDQTYDFPQEEFQLEENSLTFHNIPLSKLIEEFGSPLKFTYLPKISENISKIKQWFSEVIIEAEYPMSYHYCYCTKSSHFKHVITETLKAGAHLETSSAFDLNIITSLIAEGLVTKDHFLLCNGFKRYNYIDNIAKLINDGFKVIPVIDNYEELDLLCEKAKKKFPIGIRIASEEEPKFEFYTSRLGIGYKNIIPYYLNEIEPNDFVELKMLHFFINTGIRDNAYYWNELHKCLKVYIKLKRVCPTLDSLNIGGGFPIKNSLSFEYDYKYMITEIVTQIKQVCDEAGVAPPHLFTEFGSYTVGESGGAIYEILYQKKQNDKEKWNIINSSFITTLPDTWAINKRFIMLPINRWNDEYERVLLGGLTCDSDDYYNSEQNVNAIYLPVYDKNKPLYIGFFNTGAYQEALGGYGGVQHCLIPQPKHILIHKDENGNLTYNQFKAEQTAEQMLNILGYE